MFIKSLVTRTDSLRLFHTVALVRLILQISRNVAATYYIDYYTVTWGGIAWHELTEHKVVVIR